MQSEEIKNLYLKNIKSSLNKIAKYIPGESELGKKGKIIKLSSNESPFKIPKNIHQMTFKNLKNFNRYPDGDSKALKKAISKKYKIKQSQIICGNGSDDILSLIGLAFSKESCEIICHKFGFIYYPIIAYSVGAKVIYADPEGLGISTKNLLKSITPKTRIIFFANPNNPTGTIILRTDLIDFLKKVPKNIIIVLDGAYAEYVEEKNFSDGLELVKSFPNLIVTRTFSKIYAMAGLRIGWAYSSQKIIDILEKIRGPFNVNSIAQISASLILEDKKFINKSIKHNTKYKKWLTQELDKIGFNTYSSYTNFIIIKTKLSTNFVVKKLQESGILIRDLNNYGLKKFLRISIGLEVELKKLIKELKKITKDDKNK